MNSQNWFMAIFLFSIVVLVGFIPAVFCLNQLFAITFARAAKARPDTKDTFWQPRGFADTGSVGALEESRRPLGKGISWLIRTPDTLADDSNAGVLLLAYRFLALIGFIGIAGVLSFLFIF